MSLFMSYNDIILPLVFSISVWHILNILWLTYGIGVHHVTLGFLSKQHQGLGNSMND